VISDNGIGFNAKKEKRGIGIQNMLSRTKECHKAFNQKKRSTTITIIVPIEQN
jgi:signal transduction histidine kinase